MRIIRRGISAVALLALISGQANATYMGSPPLLVVNGGTGAQTLTAHGVLIGAAAGPIVASSTGASGVPLIGQGASADPIFGTAAVAGGGTGLTSGTSGGVLGYTATGTLASSAALTVNNPVIGGGAGATPISGTRSGNTTTFATTTTGPFTSGHIATFDGSGNLNDGGAPGLAWTSTVITAAGGQTMPATNNYRLVMNKTSGAATAVTGVASPATDLTQCIIDGKGDAATNNITFTPAAAGTVNGSPTYVVNQPHGSVCFFYNGTEYTIW